MIAAPGKLFTTGAYAVLEGAPAVVMAVDRYVRADATRRPLISRPEVAAVARRLGRDEPWVDVEGLERGGRKLGLGSSAAAAVAAAGALVDDDPSDPAVRRQIFDIARAAHADVQPRGSGGDVAAATFGGVVIVRRVGDALQVEHAELPLGVVFQAFSLARSARTSDALDRLAARREAACDSLDELVAAANAGAEAVARGWGEAFLAACAAHVSGLSKLGIVLDLPLVPPELERARAVLRSSAVKGSSVDLREDPVLLPSGAGGGDTVLWLGARAPSEQEAASLSHLGLEPIALSIEHLGVHRTKRN